MQPENTRRTAWSPPPRPDWVARLNQEGTCLDIKGIIPLDPTSLIKTATENTGLTNFGSDDWREPFEVVCRSLDAEAQLNLMGRIMTRSDMLMFLEARLAVEAAYQAHPEIEDEEITAPILIVGQGRSGTSALLNLLAQDPGNNVLRTWEGLFPGPPENPDAPDSRFEVADHRMRMWARVTPEIEAMHEFTAEIPTENIQIEALSFQAPGWQALLGHNPSHYAYMAAHSMAPAFAYGKRVLKLLQWRHGKKPWVLKSPDAMNYFADFLKIYPDVNLVFLHRDPIISLSSMVSLVGTLSWIRSDHLMTAGTFEAVTDPVMAERMLTAPLAAIAAGTLQKERVHSILYNDFVTDPLAAAAGVYAYFGRALSPTGRQAMQDYLDAHPRASRPAHRYKIAAGDAISAERRIFKRYQDYFGVPSEV